MAGYIVKPPARLLKDPFDVAIRVSDSSPIGLLGVPWDWSTAGRPGARFAPQHVRSVLYSLRPHVVGGEGLEIQVRDLGDVDVVPGVFEETGRRIASAASQAYNMLRFTVFIGGDHSITRWTLEPLLVEDEVGLLVLDAHYDMRSTSEGLTSGSWLYDVASKSPGRLRVVVVGVADFLNPSYLAERAKRIGAKIIAARDVHEKGVEVVLEAIDGLREEGLGKYYVSVDMDHIAEAYAPGVNSPSPLGLEPWTSAAILRYAVSKLKPVAADVVEIVPAYDVNNATSRLAAHLILYMLYEAWRWANALR